jgi:hypothetical protein
VWVERAVVAVGRVRSAGRAVVEREVEMPWGGVSGWCGGRRW